MRGYFLEASDAVDKGECLEGLSALQMRYQHAYGDSTLQCFRLL